MPSGYTAKLYEGEQSFEDFVLGAARGMGALVTMREEPSDAEIPERLEASTDYYDRQIREGKARLLELDALTEQDAAREATREYAEAVEANTKDRVEREGKRARYEAMWARVEAWEPPTEDHVGLKKFMREQIQQSIDFDCTPTDRNPQALNALAWLENQRQKAQRDISYGEEHRAKELERTEGRNAWLSALRSSLAQKEKEKSPFTPSSTAPTRQEEKR